MPGTTRRKKVFKLTITPAQQLETELTLLKLIKEKEYKFHPTRKWRFDFAWPDIKFAVEVEGGIFVNGAHTRGAHFRSDCEKYAEALLLGWRVLRVEDSMIKKGRALQIIEQILKESKPKKSTFGFVRNLLCPNCGDYHPVEHEYMGMPLLSCPKMEDNKLMCFNTRIP